jgi:hypothetical protein
LALLVITPASPMIQRPGVNQLCLIITHTLASGLANVESHVHRST